MITTTPRKLRWKSWLHRQSDIGAKLRLENGTVYYTMATARILCHTVSRFECWDLDIWKFRYLSGYLKQPSQQLCLSGRDRLVVRTLRCGRSNPGSNPGHGIFPLLRFALKRAHIEVEQRGVIKFQSLMCHHTM